MKTFLFRLWQWTWGLPQTLLGAIVFLIYYKCPHERFHDTIVTHWPKTSSMGVGMFLFLGSHGNPEIDRQVLVHEYGHAVQSLMLGPLFLPIMGIPSFLWAGIPFFQKLRKTKHISYYSFYPEKSANHLGRAVLKMKCDLR